MPPYFQTPAIESAIFPADVIVFDLNGLIVDDEPVQLAATNEALAPYRCPIDLETWIRECVGHKPAEFLPKILKDCPHTTEDIAKIVCAKDLAYAEKIVQTAASIVRSGVMDFLDHLATLPATRIALATSTTAHGAQTLLGPSCLNILNRFDFVICGDEVRKSKPDPEIYLKVKTHYPQSRKFVAFEDSRLGVLSAKNAGLTCIAVPNAFTIASDLSAADLIVTDLTATAKRIT